MSEKTTQRITITLPVEVYQKIKESAERDTRTIGEQITHLLKLYVPSYTPTKFMSHDVPGIRSPENPTGQSHTPTANIDTNTYYATHNAQGRRTVIG